MAVSAISNEDLKSIRDEILKEGNGCRAWQIKDILTGRSISIDESTIRGRFIEMGEPLGGNVGKQKAPEAKVQLKVAKPISKKLEITKKNHVAVDHLQMYVPKANEFTGYIERDIDRRLGVHYDCSRPGNWKYPLTQGKQGTGKTYSHMYYAYKNRLPFFLFSAFEDFKLHKLFGDKTIANGNVVFKEGLLVQAIQHPSVILVDEVNYISNENSVDFHAFLQNRELFVKDADNGNGKIYRLHDDCKIGFAQNPKSAKYIGGNIKPSNFLGRCTYLTYPEFTKADIKKAIAVRFPNLVPEDINKFTEFYFACAECIDKAQIPVDISIRQLNNVIDLYNHGLPLHEAIEDGLTSIMEAASQPKSKEAFTKLAELVWKEMMKKSIDENVGQFENMVLSSGRRSNAKSVKRVSVSNQP